MEWQEALLKYGEQAVNTGKELRFAVVKRPDRVQWRIYLSDLVEHGEEEVIED